MWNSTASNWSTTVVAAGLDELMNQGASFNIYMGFGGTNFGWMNGAGVIQSYDYDAPISENGAHGFGADGLDKFSALRKVIAKHTGEAPPPDPPVRPVLVPNPLKPVGAVSLWDILDALSDRVHVLHNGTAKFAEYFDQFYGFTLYDFGPLPLHSSSSSKSQVILPAFADRASVYLGRTQIALFQSGAPSASISNISFSTAPFRVLVENVGRVNVWHQMPDQRKGRWCCFRLFFLLCFG